jgi:hypothetical protein
MNLTGCLVRFEHGCQTRYFQSVYTQGAAVIQTCSSVQPSLLPSLRGSHEVDRMPYEMPSKPPPNIMAWVTYTTQMGYSIFWTTCTHQGDNSAIHMMYNDAYKSAQLVGYL